MNNSIIKKIAGVLGIVIVGLSFGSVAFATTSQNCASGSNFCVELTDTLPDNSTGIDANTNVTLSFSLKDKDNVIHQVCRSGSLYHIVKHNIDGAADKYDYVGSGSGRDFDYSFGSGNAQQKNRYSGYFYCSDSALSGDPKTINDSLGLLFGIGQMWQSPEFNLATRVAPPAAGVPPAGSGTTLEQKGTETVPNSSGPTQIINPLGGGINNLFDLFLKLLKIMMSVLGGLAVAVIMVGGFRMVLAQGNEEAVGVAKKTITWAVIGLVVALLSFAMIAIVQNYLGADIGSPAQYLNGK